MTCETGSSKKYHDPFFEYFANCTFTSILHYNGVLDAYGHMSVRNPNNESNFFMSRNVAPALVANSSDIVEYQVMDAAPIDPNAPKGFIERYIHSELYKRFPDISSVVHSHSPQVIPYSISGVPLRPCIHMAGFLGEGSFCLVLDVVLTICQQARASQIST